MPTLDSTGISLEDGSGSLLLEDGSFLLLENSGVSTVDTHDGGDYYDYWARQWKAAQDRENKRGRPSKKVIEERQEIVEEVLEALDVPEPVAERVAVKIEMTLRPNVPRLTFDHLVLQSRQIIEEARELAMQEAQADEDDAMNALAMILERL